MPQTVYRLPAVKSESVYPDATTDLCIAQALWTEQVSLGPRIAGKTDDEIRELVVKVELPAKRRGVVLLFEFEQEVLTPYPDKETSKTQNSKRRQMFS